MSPQASIMTGTVQSTALGGRPGRRPWRRGREARAPPEDMQELLLPTPLEMHKVGAGRRRPGCVSWCREDSRWAPDGPPLSGFVLLHHKIGVLY